MPLSEIQQAHRIAERGGAGGRVILETVIRILLRNISPQLPASNTIQED